MISFIPSQGTRTFEDHQSTRMLERILRKNRKLVFRKPKRGDPVVLILSGGLDSVMFWHFLLERGYVVYPIHFTGHQSILGENTSVRYFSSFFKKRFGHLVQPVVNIPIYYNYSFEGKKALGVFTNNKVLFAKNSYISQLNHNPRVMMMNYPLRLAYYALTSYEYCLALQSRGVMVNTVFTGLVTEDSQVMRESTLTVLRALNVYVCSLFGDWGWQIGGKMRGSGMFIPNKSKSIRSWAMGGLPLGKTWSCNKNFPLHCGICNGCKNRQISFENAGVSDPTQYLVSKALLIRLRLLLTHWSNLLTVFHFSKKRLALSPQTDIKNNLCFTTHQGTTHSITVNSVGVLILKYIKKKDSCTVDQVVEYIQKQFNSDNKKRVRTDTEIFLRDLYMRGVIRLL